MIGAVEGIVVSKQPGKILLKTESGLYYDLFVPISDFSKLELDKKFFFYTVLKIKDDDAFLFGFTEKDKKELFEKLITVSGVGPKTALSCVSTYSVSEFVNAIEESDVSKISGIPGIGKKTAQRIIVDLSGKLIFEREEIIEEKVKLRDDVVSGLINLGYSSKSVKSAVEHVIKNNKDIDDFGELFKLSLKRLTKS